MNLNSCVSLVCVLFVASIGVEISILEGVGLLSLHQTDDGVMRKAHILAVKAYDSENPVEKAHWALNIHPICPEAYNVLALHSADSYSEVLILHS